MLLLAVDMVYVIDIFKVGMQSLKVFYIQNMPDIKSLQEYILPK